jgi:hypothetical protein
MDLEQEDFTVSQFKEFKDEGDHIDFVIPSEFNLVAEKTILLTKLKKNDKYPWQKNKKKNLQAMECMQVSGIFINSTLS